MGVSRRGDRVNDSPGCGVQSQRAQETWVGDAPEIAPLPSDAPEAPRRCEKHTVSPRVPLSKGEGGLFFVRGLASGLCVVEISFRLSKWLENEVGEHWDSQSG